MDPSSHTASDIIKEPDKKEATDTTQSDENIAEESGSNGKTDSPPGNLCQLCDAQIVTEQAAQSHFDGAKHKKKVKRYQIMKSLAKEFGIVVDEPDENIDRKLSLPRLSFLEKQVAKLLNCTTCNISVTGFENMLSHLGTTKHQQAVLAANGYKPPTAEQTRKLPQPGPKSQPPVNRKPFQQPQKPYTAKIQSSPRFPNSYQSNRPPQFQPKAASVSRMRPPAARAPQRQTKQPFASRGRGAPTGMHPLRPQFVEPVDTSFNQSGWYGDSIGNQFLNSADSGNMSMSNYGGYAPDNDNYSYSQQRNFENESPYRFKYSGGFTSHMSDNFPTGMNPQSPEKRRFVDDSMSAMPSNKAAYYPSEQQYSMDYNHGQYSSYANSF